MSKKPGFRTPFDMQQAKRSQILMIYARQHFYHSFSSSIFARVIKKHDKSAAMKISAVFETL